MKEVASRPKVYKIWKWIERKTVPLFKWGYTVNEPIRDIFKKEYSVSYGVIRNLPLRTIETMPADKQTFIIYQGAVNHGRSFETLIPAFNHTDFPLHIYGDGNFLEEAKAITIKYQLSNKVLFKGKALPTELKKITPSAILGITLFENNGLSNYYSLANRFFDYIQAGIPQLCVNYPAYKKINDEYDIAVLIEDLSPISIATAINDFLKSEEVQNKLRANCLKAREELNWQKEEKVLLHFYENLFSK
jgi:glycosyltransferase involved in cell wall biosynthesis